MLKYSYLDEKKVYHVIINANLSGFEEEQLLETLRKYRGAIGYSLYNHKKISPRSANILSISSLMLNQLLIINDG